MQTTVDSLANSNSKATLARLVIEERARHQQEHRELVALQQQAQDAINKNQRLEATVTHLSDACGMLNRARDLLIRVVERLLDGDEAKNVVIDSLRKELEELRTQNHSIRSTALHFAANQKASK
jgi:hypothetical protein